MNEIRVTDLMTALSLAVDLGLGQPAGHVVRSAVVAARLDARRPHPSGQTELFDVAMFGWVGCIADSQDAARWFGDDIEYRAGVYDLDMAPLPFLGYLVSHAGAADPLPVRTAKRAGVLLDAGRSARQSLLAHCQVTAQVARRLGLSAPVCDGLTQIFARWDGRGLPRDLSGSAIAPTVRAWQLADLAEVHHARGGEEAVQRVCRDRRGGQLDPQLVDLALADVQGLFAGLEDDADWEQVLASERGAGPPLPSATVDAALETLADWVDLKSSWFSGHSRAVADLAGEGARVLGLAPTEVTLVRRAGLLSDIGRAGVSNAVWDKAGPLSPTEVEKVRLHSYLTERVLGRIAALAEVGAVAALAHERLDGSGYHRGLSGASIPMTGRLLAAAEAYRTSLEARPHRDALTPEAATARLRVIQRPELRLGARQAALPPSVDQVPHDRQQAAQCAALDCCGHARICPATATPLQHAPLDPPRGSGHRARVRRSRKTSCRPMSIWGIAVRPVSESGHQGRSTTKEKKR